MEGKKEVAAAVVAEAAAAAACASFLRKAASSFWLGIIIISLGVSDFAEKHHPVAASVGSVFFLLHRTSSRQEEKREDGGEMACWILLMQELISWEVVWDLKEKKREDGGMMWWSWLLIMQEILMWEEVWDLKPELQFWELLMEGQESMMRICMVEEQWRLLRSLRTEEQLSTALVMIKFLWRSLQLEEELLEGPSSFFSIGQVLLSHFRTSLVPPSQQQLQTSSMWGCCMTCMPVQISLLQDQCPNETMNLKSWRGRKGILISKSFALLLLLLFASYFALES
jgi:hypothetical protein